MLPLVSVTKNCSATSTSSHNSLLSMWESRDVLPIQIKDISSHGGKMYIVRHLMQCTEHEPSINDDGAAIEGLAKLAQETMCLGARDIKICQGNNRLWIRAKWTDTN